MNKLISLDVIVVDAVPLVSRYILNLDRKVVKILCRIYIKLNYCKGYKNCIIPQKKNKF